MKKTKNIHLIGRSILLRDIKLNDVNSNYVLWLNSSQINQYLETRFTKHTIKSVKNYVSELKKNKDVLFLAIIRNSDSKHIGNIKLGPIDWNHKNSDIGIMVGDKDSWGKGFASESISLLANYSFKTLKLHKITAGIYVNNEGSIHAFKKAGFYKEGKLKKHFLYKGQYIDGIKVTKFSKFNLFPRN